MQDARDRAIQVMMNSLKDAPIIDLSNLRYRERKAQEYGERKEQKYVDWNILTNTKNIRSGRFDKWFLLDDSGTLKPIKKLRFGDMKDAIGEELAGGVLDREDRLKILKSAWNELRTRHKIMRKYIDFKKKEAKLAAESGPPEAESDSEESEESVEVGDIVVYTDSEEGERLGTIKKIKTKKGEQIYTVDIGDFEEPIKLKRDKFRLQEKSSESPSQSKSSSQERRAREEEARRAREEEARRAREAAEWRVERRAFKLTELPSANMKYKDQSLAWLPSERDNDPMRDDVSTPEF